VGVAEIVQNDIIDNKEVKNIIISPITLTEIYYIFCRQKGEESAKKLPEKSSVLLELNLNSMFVILRENISVDRSN